jgi:hypothetical protein
MIASAVLIVLLMMGAASTCRKHPKQKRINTTA